MWPATRHRTPRGPRSLFWLTPALSAGAAVGLVAALITSRLNVTAPFVFQGPPSDARSSLNSIVTVMISLTGLVFSLAFVAVQLSSGQYSPRVLQIYLRDRIIQGTFGGFVATFVYALVVGQSVQADAQVPRVSVSGAPGDAALSVGRPA